MVPVMDARNNIILAKLPQKGRKRNAHVIAFVTRTEHVKATNSKRISKSRDISGSQRYPKKGEFIQRTHRQEQKIFRNSSTTQ